MQGANVPPPEDDEKPLPPPPPQFNKPVGPPPSADSVKTPENFDEYMEWAKIARSGRMDMAHLWAALAQADATDRMANELNRLNEFLGVFDNDGEDDDDEDDDKPSSRLSEKLAEAAINALDIVIAAAPELLERVTLVLAKAGIGPKKD